ncbi:hypothetical protein SAMN05421788_102512 [Filimonas lacunae]|uniref:Uncharacterized protein n=1 Tax=Filimonas lacunae TaxID=477680 RepID=A0A1N7NKG4_9BACT|nr:hypothetical protein SAMN05421788_102512 [Filimonas lacunae]
MCPHDALHPDFRQQNNSGYLSNKLLRHLIAVVMVERCVAIADEKTDTISPTGI